MLGALGEFRVLGAVLGAQKIALGMRNPISRNGVSRLEQCQSLTLPALQKNFVNFFLLFRVCLVIFALKHGGDFW